MTKQKQKTKGRVIKQKLELDWGKKADRQSEEREDSTVVQTKGRESGSNWGGENKKILKQATLTEDRYLIKMTLGGSPDLEGWNI